MSLRARLVVEGFITGLHKSPYHGFSVEFSEHRPYMAGDEIKNVDWKIYGRTDRFYIKQFEEETNLKSYILLDASASMGYTSGGVTKLEYGSYLAAALTYLMLKQRDAVGLTIFDERIRVHIPPRSKFSYLEVLLEMLENLSPGNQTDLSITFHELAERIKRRGLIIVISDLFDNMDKVINGLKHFRHKKHEVIVFHILDPAEVEFSFDRYTTFIDVETGERLTTEPWHLKRNYLEKIAEFINYYKVHCREHRIDYTLIKSSESLDTALTGYLNRRRRIGG